MTHTPTQATASYYDRPLPSVGDVIGTYSNSGMANCSIDHERERGVHCRSELLDFSTFKRTGKQFRVVVDMVGSGL